LKPEALIRFEGQEGRGKRAKNSAKDEVDEQFSPRTNPPTLLFISISTMQASLTTSIAARRGVALRAQVRHGALVMGPRKGAGAAA
jgi:hypothetical protein